MLCCAALCCTAAVCCGCRVMCNVLQSWAPIAAHQPGVSGSTPQHCVTRGAPGSPGTLFFWAAWQGATGPLGTRSQTSPQGHFGGSPVTFGITLVVTAFAGGGTVSSTVVCLCPGEGLQVPTCMAAADLCAGRSLGVLIMSGCASKLQEQHNWWLAVRLLGTHHTRCYMMCWNTTCVLVPEWCSKSDLSLCCGTAQLLGVV
jgi:hypothetical protein